MADIRGYIKLAATVVGLALLCVLAYYLLLYLVTPHPPHVDQPVPSDLPPGAEVYPGGYIVTHPQDNLTAEERIAMLNNSSTEYGEVSFFELPLWIQLYVLPGLLFGAIPHYWRRRP